MDVAQASGPTAIAKVSAHAIPRHPFPDVGIAATFDVQVIPSNDE
jgi:hypothetical protein